MKRIFFRAALLFAAAAYVALAGLHWVGEGPIARPTGDAQLNTALRWDPANADLWWRHALSEMYSNGGFAPDRARAAYVQAVRHDPLEPVAWQELANAEMLLGDQAAAERALRKGLFAGPLARQLSWQLANLLLLTGREREAIPYFRRTLETQAELRQAVCAIAWKISSSPETIFRDIVPRTPEAVSYYLQFLISTARLQYGYPVWSELRKHPLPTTPEVGGSFALRLASAGRRQEALRVWDEVLADTRRSDLKPPESLLTNGDFEGALLNYGLDWVKDTNPCCDVSVDQAVSEHGSSSLRIDFDGNSNPEIVLARQVVPLEPNQSYRLIGYIRTESLTSTSGIRLCVDQDASSACSDHVVGTNPWVMQTVKFTVEAHTSVVRVVVRRLASPRVNKLIGGTAWIDHLTLEPRP